MRSPPFTAQLAETQTSSHFIIHRIPSLRHKKERLVPSFVTDYLMKDMYSAMFYKFCSLCFMALFTESVGGLGKGCLASEFSSLCLIGF